MILFMFAPAIGRSSDYVLQKKARNHITRPLARPRGLQRRSSHCGWDNKGGEFTSGALPRHEYALLALPGDKA